MPDAAFGIRPPVVTGRVGASDCDRDRDRDRDRANFGAGLCDSASCLAPRRGLGRFRVSTTPSGLTRLSCPSTACFEELLAVGGALGRGSESPAAATGEAAVRVTVSARMRARGQPRAALITRWFIRRIRLDDTGLPPSAVVGRTAALPDRQRTVVVLL
ncbi:hypothetical protein [Streptomyces sp. NBC_01546]|uniref:hypothetical protein n=1 Tax=Streptomyces sp. NBC_01546 TaxID=2975872 RepID=UPI0038646093